MNINLKLILILLSAYCYQNQCYAVAMTTEQKIEFLNKKVELLYKAIDNEAKKLSDDLVNNPKLSSGKIKPAINTTINNLYTAMK